MEEMNLNKIEEFKGNEILKEILKDSLGGIMYNVANIDKYNTIKLKTLWDKLDIYEKNNILANGIYKGALDFVGVIKK